MYRRFNKLGVDLAEDAVEVAPTAHYAMGGVRIDWKTGETSVDNLYALGEAVAGVHGANRLGGNSLAETVAMGVTVGNEISGQELGEPPALDTAIRNDELTVSDEVHEAIEKMQLRIRETLEENVGLRRNEEDLRTGRANLLRSRQLLKQYTPQTTGSLQTYWDAVSMAESGILIADFALKRDESRGAHYRTDKPDTDDTQQHNLVCGPEKGIREEPVGEMSETVREAVEEDHELDYVQLE
jgi:succinate dehydrogenase / fumarate reductase flavoprotein subunit